MFNYCGEMINPTTTYILADKLQSIPGVGKIRVQCGVGVQQRRGWQFRRSILFRDFPTRSHASVALPQVEVERCLRNSLHVPDPKANLP